MPRIGGAWVEVRPESAGFRGQVRRDIAQALSAVNASIPIAADGRRLREDVRRAAAGATAGVNASVGVTADSKGLRGEVARAAAAATAGQNVKLGVSVDDRKLKSLLASLTGGVAGAGAALQGLVIPPAFLQGIAAATAGLVSMAGAAVAVIAPLGQLAGLIPALAVGGIAVAAGFGVVAGAMSGVGAALKAYTAEQKEASTAAAGGGQSARAAARAHEAAAEAVENASERLARAQENQVRDAENSADAIASAQENVADAYEAQTESAERGAERVAAAQNRVVEAHESVVDAEEDLTAMREDLAERSAEAQERYAERVAQSNEDILRAEEDLADARIRLAEDVADAQERLEEGRLEGQDRIRAAEQRISDVQRRAADEERERRQRARDRSALDAATTPEQRRQIQAQIDARKDREDQAKDQERAARDLKDAQDDLARIQRENTEREKRDREALATAQERQAEGIEEAEHNVTRARQEGLKVQREGQALARQAVEDERRIARAVEDVKDARKAEAEAQREVGRAQLDASRDAVKAQDAVADAVATLARTQRDAERSAQDAQRAVTDAGRDLERAMRRAGEVAEEAGTTGAAAVDKFAVAMDGLSPAAQSFVRALIGVKDTLKVLRDAAAEGLFPGFEAGLRNVNPLLVSLAPSVSLVARSIGGLAEELGALLGGPESLAGFAALGASSADILDRLGRAALILIPPLGQLLVHAIPLATVLADMAVSGAKVFAAFVDGKAKTGELSQMFKNTESTLRTLGSISNNVGGALRGVFTAALPTGLQYLGLLDTATQKLRDLVRSDSGQSGLRRFFEESKPLVLELGGLIGDVVTGLGGIGAKLAPELTPVIAQIRSELVPALLSLVDSIDADFLSTLVTLTTQVANFAGAFFAPTESLKFILTLIGNLAEVSTTLLTELGPVSGLLRELATWATFAGTALTGAAIARKLSEISLTRKGIEGVTTALGGSGGGGLHAAFAKLVLPVAAYAALKQTMDDLSPSIGKVTDAVRLSKDPLATFTVEVNKLADPSIGDRLKIGYKGFLEGLAGIAGSSRSIPEALRSARDAVLGFGDTATITAKVFKDMAREAPADAIRLLQAMKDAGQPTAEFERIIRDLGLGQQFMAAETATATQKIKDQAQARKDAREASKDAIRSELDMLDATDRYSKSLEENGASHEENTTKGRANIRAREDLLSAVDRNIEALLRDAEHNGADAEQVSELRNRLDELKNKYPELAGELEDAASRMDRGLQGIRDKQVYLQVHGVSPENDRTLGTAGDPDARPIGANTGRLVPGTGNSDTVPAWLTPGEFVTRKAVVEKQGAGAFAALNAGNADIVRRYGVGGYVHPPDASRFRLGGAVELRLGLPDIQALLASSEGWVGDQFGLITEDAQAALNAQAASATTTSPIGGGGGDDIGGHGSVGTTWQSITDALDRVGMDYTVTSAYRAGDAGFHGRGKAVDLVGDMPAIFNTLAGYDGINELFFDPMGYFIDEGVRHSGAIGDHEDHVHAATFDRGGVLEPGWNRVRNATGARESLVPAEGGPGLRDLLTAVRTLITATERAASHTHPVEIDGRPAGQALESHISEAQARKRTSRRRG